jgi:hypothetical protein
VISYVHIKRTCGHGLLLGVAVVACHREEQAVVGVAQNAVSAENQPPLDHERFSAHRELEALLKATLRGDVRFDLGSRALYAADSSNYRQLPVGVVCPATPPMLRPPWLPAAPPEPPFCRAARAPAWPANAPTSPWSSTSRAT